MKAIKYWQPVYIMIHMVLIIMNEILFWERVI